MTALCRKRVWRALVAIVMMLVPVVAAAQGLNTLRPSTRAIERAVSEQVQARLVPTLSVRRSTGPARDLAVGAAGEVLAVVDGAGDGRVFDLGTGQQVAAHAAPKAAFAEVAVGAGGRPVALRDRDGRVFLAAHAGAGLRGPIAELPRARTLAVTADGDRVAVGTADGRVVVLDTAADRVVARVRGAGGAITALAPVGAAFLVGDANGVVARLSPNGARARVARMPDAVTAVVGLAGGRIAVGDAAGRVRVVGDGGDADGGGDAASDRWRGHDGAVLALAGAPGGHVLSGGSDGAVRLWRLGARRAAGTLRGADGADGGPASGLAAVVHDGAARVLATGAPNGVSVFDPGADGPLVRLILVQGAWGAVDADGRFDGSEPAFRDIRWRAGGATLGLDRFAARYFEPGLLAKHLRPGTAFLTAGTDGIGDGIYAPPEVTVAVDAGRARAGAPVRVRVTAETVAPASISEVLLFHNGKRVPADRVRDRTRQDDRGVRTVTVAHELPLVAGENRFRAVAVGWGRLWSAPARARLEARAVKTTPATLRLNAVGVNRYRNPRLNLNYAVADAKGVARLVGERAGPLFDDVHTRLLLDRDAHRRAVLDRLDALGDSGARDTAVVFLSGHGRTVGDDWYYLPHDLEYLGDDGHVRDVGISGTDLAKRLIASPAQRILVIIDTCQAGAFIGDLDALGQRRALRELRERTGVYVIAATRADQLAPEYRSLGHGLLTYVLLRGMRDGDGGRLLADTDPANGVLTVRELQRYVEREVPLMAHELDAKLRSPVSAGKDFTDRAPVTPVGLALGADFALARR
jgi:WD40 repeat protein